MRLFHFAILVLFQATSASAAVAQSIFADGFEDPCSVDSDGDRLSDCQELIYGTSVLNPDTDGDGLSDGDEVLGTLGGLDLPAMGVNPRRRDILMEHDWVIDASGCSTHSHEPSLQALDELAQLFADAPVENHDGSMGINLISDVGQGGVFTGGSLITIAGGTINGSVTGAAFAGYKANSFASNRIGYFHYAIHAHSYTQYPYSSGQAELVGDDMIISLACSLSDEYVRNTIMHELGHNLGLLHGGGSSCNFKPNYNSIMNYRFQFPGIDIDCDRMGDGPADFSTGSRIAIDENNISESNGVCGTTPIDWNGDEMIQDGIQYDINPGGNSACGGTYTTLSDFDDWANLILASLPGAPGSGQPVGVSECQDVPPLQEGAE